MENAIVCYNHRTKDVFHHKVPMLIRIKIRYILGQNNDKTARKIVIISALGCLGPVESSYTQPTIPAFVIIISGVY